MEEEKINAIIRLAKEGKTNLEIARHPEVMLKYSTLCLWKKKLRAAGYEIESRHGRPREE